MNSIKEKSAVGVGAPATEMDIKNTSDIIISASDEKFKRFGGKT